MNLAQSPPRHYDKFTYSTRRRPENESPPRERLGGSFFSPRANRPPTEYEACVAGIAPLPRTPDGFAIAEDGTLMSRFCSPSRWGAPAVALVSIPVHVIAREKIPGSSAPQSTEIIGLAPRGAVEGTFASVEVNSWKKLLIAAGRDFSERELIDVSWDTLSQLLTHYGFVNPVENARIQLTWKQKNGIESQQQYSGGAGGLPLTLLPSDHRKPLDQFYVPATSLNSPTTIITSPNRSFADRPLSPRRMGTESERVVPEYKRPMRWEHVSPKVDTGSARKRTGSRSPVRAGVN